LNAIIERTGAVIVVHSSWRWNHSLESLRGTLTKWGVVGTVLDVCPYPQSIRVKMSGVILDDVDWEAFKGDIASNHERCIAIQKWLDAHPEVKKYVILDDSADLGHFVGKPEFIRTNGTEGLTKAHADRAILHLKGVTW
jgi:hypothetical protein